MYKIIDFRDFWTFELFEEALRFMFIENFLFKIKFLIKVWL